MLVKKITHIERKTSSRSAGKRDTFVAMLYDDERNRHIPVYFKIFPEEVSGKCQFNEFLGSYFVRRLGLYTPDLHVAFCHPDLLRPYGAKLSRTLGAHMIPGTASENVMPRGVIQINRDSPLFWANLMNWQRIYLLAAIDELIGNTDRTVFNVLQIGTNYIPIDHDQCLGCESTEPEALKKALTGPTYKNLLAEEIGKCADVEIKNRMVLAAQNTIAMNSFRNIDFGFDTDNFFNLPVGTTSYVLNLLEMRKKNLAEYMHAYIRMNSFLLTSA